MPSFEELVHQGAAHAWLFMPSAVLLGVLHGLEPGHSKTMMAAFIVAIRGSVFQAVLLGLCATVSHTLIVWALAVGGLSLGKNFDAETSEPYFQLASAALVIAIAIWMLARIRRDQTRRARQGDHAHDHDHRHDHGRIHPAAPLVAVQGDTHQREHAMDIELRLAGRPVTTAQIALFGLTGGLIPCPAAITVLLLCLQLREIALGATLVLCFSIGLAITLVSVGVVAAVSARQASARSPWFATLATRAPYASILLIVAVGIYMGVQGWIGLRA